MPEEFDYEDDIKQDIEEARANGFSDLEIEEFLKNKYGKEEARKFMYPDVQRVELVGAKIVTIKGKDGERGPKGRTPVKGKDYFTKAEINEFKIDVTPVKGSDYFTEREIKQFKKEVTPIKGSDYLTKEEIENFKKWVTPKKGVDYFDGLPGQPGEKGDKGDKIKHRWIGTQLQFENPDGSWGDAVELRQGLYTMEPQRHIGRGGGLPLTTKGDIVVFNGSEAVRLPVGSDTQVLTVDSSTSTGLKWAAPSGGSGTPGGSDTQVQFNDGGSFGGDSGFTWNKTTDTLTVGAGAGIVVTHSIKSDASDGLLVEASNGTDVGVLGAGNTANVTWYGSHNYDTATADTIASFGASKTLSSLSTATYPSLTELSYVKGVTSAIQTQINTKKTDNVSATSRILGRITAGAGAIEELTGAQATTLLSEMVGDSGAGGTKGLVPAPGVGDSTKFLKGDGTWGSPAGSGDVSAAANITANRIVIGDDGVKGVKQSLVTISDTGEISEITLLEVVNGGALRTEQGDAATVLLQAYDVDGAAFTTFATLTAGNTPTFNLSDAVTKGGQYIYRGGGTDVALADGGTGASLADPNDDRIMMWDDSAGAVVFMDIGTGLTIDATPILSVDQSTAFAWTDAHTHTVAGLTQTLTNSSDSASVQVAIFQGDRATMADNDEAYISLRLSNDGGTQTEVARLTWVATDVNAATSVDGRIDFAVMTAGSLADKLQLDGTALSPSTNDGLAFGTTSLGISDIHLASGGNITAGGANAFRTLILSAAGGSPTTTIGCGGPTKVEAGTNDIDYWVLEYDTTTEERAFWVVQMPDNYDGGTVTARFIWTNAAGLTTETVRWGIKAIAYADSDAIDQAYGSEVTVDDTWLAQGDIHISSATSAITIGGSPAGGRPVIFNVGRKVANDNLTGDARLLAVHIEYSISTYSD